MDEGVQKLKEDLAQVEYEAERLLLARQELIESDKARNGNREALTALRRLARTSQSSVPVVHEFADESIKEVKEGCRTCGDYDGDEAVWYLCPGGDLFLSLPFHATHSKLEKDQEQLELTVKKLQSMIKDKALSLSDKGAIADKIGPNLMKALVTLKDNH